MLGRSHKRSRLLTFFASARILFCTSLSLQQRSMSASHDFNTLQIGLTGSMGMGKSTISNHLIKLGFPLFDADLSVHKLYAESGAAVQPIQAVLPDVIVDGKVDRTKLTAKIMHDGSVLKTIEAIVHPLVVADRERFYARARSDRRFMAIYDIPLLFENRRNYHVDYTIVATAAPEVQHKRVMARPGMTEDKFKAIFAKQVPDAEKRKLADFLVHTDYPGYSEAQSQLCKVIESIIERNPELWKDWTSGSGLHSSAGGADPAQLSTMSAGARRLREAFDLVLFDLDDTLVPVHVQLAKATAAMKAFMATHMPKTAALVDARMRPDMKAMSVAHPLLAHDLNEIRKLALLQLARECGEEAHASRAVDVFLQARSDVTDNFYSDSVQCLEWFESLGFKIGVLTNGSADLMRCPILRKHLSLTFTAADIGTAKPSPVGFLACSQVSGVPPNRILYVGDSYECDVLGANKAGMTSVLLLRKDYSAMDVDKAGVFGAEELARRQRESFTEADIVLPSLRVADLEAAFAAHCERKG